MVTYIKHLIEYLEHAPHPNTQLTEITNIACGKMISTVFNTMGLILARHNKDKNRQKAGEAEQHWH